MAHPPRLLWVESEIDIRRELLAVGMDAGGADRLAREAGSRMLKLSGVPCEALASLKEEFAALGGRMGAARGGMVCAVAESDVILSGSLACLGDFSRKLASGNPALADIGARIGSLLEVLEHPPRVLRGRTCQLELNRPLIMGILNVTPDSFSDGGAFNSVERALQRARELAAEGADLIDVGGESTRPGAARVADDVEISRVVPVIRALRDELDLPLSVDTRKSRVAEEALAAGAEFINDISGLEHDPRMVKVAAAQGAGLFLMHARGEPETMQRDTRYGDLVGEILGSLRRSLDTALGEGIAPSRLAVDPGIGFGKSAEGNLEILRRLNEFRCLGRPILLGTSRKSFIGKVLGQSDPQGRLHGSNATVALGVARGAQIFRVHDVGPAREAALMAWAICHGAR
ncbi:hypothetical protein DESUT3_11610 [Desulfuromonas versatilis]|uniref:dihydropteroate synthase n=1 Tax=Desulfuromonas versatilis TaxID=2802975 RepID=A0ABM8HN56_9BACT|nr:dihydropteroate synthase [Desulfuromonas versatilis]BCR04092.1 hypothetical protein DESUT3_11610 [Desulfuromonas versatilis]